MGVTLVQAEDEAPPRPPLPSLYDYEDPPPAIPPLPKEASVVVRHTSVRCLKRQSDERKRDRESGGCVNGDFKVRTSLLFTFILLFIVKTSLCCATKVCAARTTVLLSGTVCKVERSIAGTYGIRKNTAVFSYRHRSPFYRAIDCHSAVLTPSSLKSH